MSKTSVFAPVIFCCTLFVVANSAHAVKTESFDTAASAAANGWVATNADDDEFQAAGFIDENMAGGAAAGEAQYHVSRGTGIAYVDTNLGMTIGGNTEGGFSLTGVLSNLGGVQVDPENPVQLSGDTGFPPILGFSTSPKEYLGIMFRGDDPGAIDPVGTGAEVAWGIRFSRDLGSEFGDIIFGAGGTDASRILVEGTSYPFSLVFDPTMGEFGTVTASVVGAGNAIPIALSQEQRDHLNAVAFTQVGMVKLSGAFNPNSNLDIRFDDLTYTGVPGANPTVDGDYNGNLVVDAADYVVWRNTLNATGPNLLADGNGDEVVNNLDYNYWRERFSNTSGSAAGLASVMVPEPVTGVSAMLCAFMLIGFRRVR